MTQSAIFYGVGVGTGDPELLTLKAFKCIQQASVISYLVDKQGYSHAKHIARLAFNTLPLAGKSKPIMLPIRMPMRLDRSEANQAYDKAAMSIARYLSQGDSVAFLCEGDPLFFGSLTYLLHRLQSHHICQIIPGISTLHSASSILIQPLTQQADSLAVVSGRHDDEKIRQALLDYDSIIIMKVGRHYQRLIHLLNETKRTADARYLANMGRDKELIIHDVNQVTVSDSGYFSVFVVTR